LLQRSGSNDFRYIAEDDYVRGSYLLVIGYAIFTTRDLRVMSWICGEKLYEGYRGGSSARFRYINGVVTSPKSHNYIWVSDQGNNCFRAVDRRFNTTSNLAGGCQLTDVKDGTYLVAGTAFPFGLTVSPAEPDVIYFFESQEWNLRCLIQVGSILYIRTVFHLARNIFGMNFDMLGEYIYISYNDKIIRTSSNWKSATEEILSGIGHNDGPLNTARIQTPRYPLSLDNNTFLVADYNNQILRLVDLRSSSVSSICVSGTGATHTDLAGPINTCRIRYPRQIVRSRTLNEIYIIGNFAIYELKYSSKFVNFIFLKSIWLKLLCKHKVLLCLFLK